MVIILRNRIVIEIKELKVKPLNNFHLIYINFFLIQLINLFLIILIILCVFKNYKIKLITIKRLNKIFNL